MALALKIKPFSFRLRRSLKTANGKLNEKKGWLIKLKNEASKYGWGEVSPFDDYERQTCKKILEALGPSPSRELLEKGLLGWPCSLSFGIGAALAEIDGLIGSSSKEGWLKNFDSAVLLPTDDSLLTELDLLLEKDKRNPTKLTLKVKLGTQPITEEKSLVHQILQKIPNDSRLRIDANASWSSSEAKDWAEYLKAESKLEWIEQPISANNIEGLEQLAVHIPIALDESIRQNPSLKHTWKSWQIRKPLLEGDPRILLNELHQKMAYRVISTSFETGIGRRWVYHLAALQQRGPTPTKPGLAPEWCPNNELFSNNPNLVWNAA